MAQPLVSIVIVGCNEARHLAACFKSLEATRYPRERIELLLVGDGSTDGFVASVAEQFPSVQMLRADGANYCRSNNVGIRAARGTYVALLDSDTRVDPNWLKPLITVLEGRPGVGGAGSKLVSLDGTRILSAGQMELPNYYWADRGFNEPDCGKYDEVRDVPSLSGAAAVYRRAALEEVGLLDEDFDRFLEDAELGYRIRAKGRRLLVVPASRVSHHLDGSASEDGDRRWWERSRLLFIAKHDPERLPAGWGAQDYFRLGLAEDPEGHGAEALAAAAKKLFRQQGSVRAAANMVELFSVAHRFIQPVPGDAVGRSQVDRQGTGNPSTEAREVPDPLAQMPDARWQMPPALLSAHGVLIIKAQRVPLGELEAWIQAFRRQSPSVRIGLLANLIPAEFDRLSVLRLVDEPWLFCPGRRRPFTWRSLAATLPRLWRRRYGAIVLPTVRVEDYEGFLRARRLAALIRPGHIYEISLGSHSNARLGHPVIRLRAWQAATDGSGPVGRAP